MQLFIVEVYIEDLYYCDRVGVALFENSVSPYLDPRRVTEQYNIQCVAQLQVPQFAPSAR